MNNLRWDLRRILKISVLGGLTLGATMVSGVQMKTGQIMPPVSSVERQHQISQDTTTEPATKASSVELYADVSEPGALYVHKDDNRIWFWVIKGENEEATVRLHSVLEIPVTTDPVKVNVIVEGISSVFYSDQLLANAAINDISYSITGEFERGRVILPLSKSVYQPLFDVRQRSPKPLTEFSGVTDIFTRQMDIYQQAEVVKEQQAMEAEEFVIKTSQLLEDYTNAVLQLSEQGEQLLTENEVEVMDVVETGTAQVEQDLDAVDDTTNEMQEYLIKNKRKTAHYFSCVAQGEIKLDNDLNEFELLADAYEEESDEVDPLKDSLDDLSELEEDHYDALQEDMHNCIGSEEVIEVMASYLPTVNIAEEGQYQEVEQFEVRALQIMAQAENLGVKAHDKGMSFVDSATSLVKIDALANIEHAFDAWISPAYLDAATLNIENSNVKSSNWDSRKKQPELDENGEALKMADALCEDYTDFDIEFDVYGVGVVIGTPLDDSIKTGNQPNLVVTLQGDDCIETHDGVDFVFSGPGEDKIFGGDHHDFLIGGKDDDEIHGSAGKTYSWGTGNVDIGNLILGAGGDDKLFGGEDDADKGEDGVVATEGFTDIILGDLWYTGDPGKDTIKGERGIDFIFGEQKDDVLSNAKTGAINIYGINFKLGSFFFAGDGNDTITGSNSTGAGLTQLLGDFIFGSKGNDTANGQGGFDFMFGGDGNDTFSGGNYFDLVFGNQDDDTVNGNDGADLVSGDKGNDKVYGNDGPFDLLLGGIGTDAMYGGNGVDLIFGSQDSDRIEGNDSVDMIFGGDAADTVNGGNGVDIIFGSKGSDYLYGNDGVDIIFGGDDADYISGGASTDVIFGNESGIKRDQLYGNDGVDIIFGNRGDDYINGGAGTDVLFGNSDNDEIVGGEGVDILFGNSGDDNLSGEGGTDVAFGNSGNDQISGGAGTDVVFGNSGCDLINGDGSTDVLFGNSGSDRIMGGDGTDVVFGNTGHDMIYGDSGTDVLFGNSDNDYINNGSGTNITFGNSGNDHIVGGDNKDIIWGNSGNDYIAGGADKDLIWGNRGHDTIDGGSSGDIIFGNRDNDLINAGHGTDWIWGNRGNDRIRGLEGKNRIWGNRGNDILDGFLGGNDTKDKLRGNRHSDTLTGNSSNDRDKLRGGAGSDNKMRNVTLLPASLFNEPTYSVDPCLQ